MFMLIKHSIPKLNLRINTRWTQIDLARKSILSSIGSTSVGINAKQTRYSLIKA